MAKDPKKNPKFQFNDQKTPYEKLGGITRELFEDNFSELLLNL